MATTLELLLSVAPPPQAPLEVRTSSDWRALEQRLGLTFPADYRQLVTRHGSGAFSWYKSRIEVLNPFSKIYESDCQQILQSSRGMRDQRLSKYAAYPANNGLYPWGRDGDGCMLIWRTAGPPSKWPTLVLAPEGVSHFERFEMKSTTFLARALTNQISVYIWSTGFTSPRQRKFKARAIGAGS